MSNDWVPDCGSKNTACSCRVVWKDGQRFVLTCGELSSFESFVVQELTDIKKALNLPSGLVP